MTRAVPSLRRLVLGLACLSVAGIGGAAALDYPTKPVRWIVGYAPAGATDILARLLGQWLSERLGPRFVIEKRPGAARQLSTERVRQAPPHGYKPPAIHPANAIHAPRVGQRHF